MRTTLRPAVLLLATTAMLLLAGLAVAAGGGPAEQGQALFKQDCSGCHTIGGGDAVGPDLKGIVATAGESTVRDFASDPDKILGSGDPKIAALVKKFHGVKMPSLGLTAAQVDALVAYLKTTGGSAAPGMRVHEVLDPGHQTLRTVEVGAIRLRTTSRRRGHTTSMSARIAAVTARPSRTIGSVWSPVVVAAGGLERNAARSACSELVSGWSR